MHIERQLPDGLEPLDDRTVAGEVVRGQPEVLTVVVEPGQGPVADAVQQGGGCGRHGHGAVSLSQGVRPPAVAALPAGGPASASSEAIRARVAANAVTRVEW